MAKTEIVNKIAKDAHLLLENAHTTPITKYNPYLISVLDLCVKNIDIMESIPERDSGDVGIAFMHVLNLTDESDSEVYQTYSSISFYYMQKFLNLGYDIVPGSEYVKVLKNMIVLMNIGAQSFCRTIARAYEQEPSYYINFQDLHNLHSYVKKVLLLEYGYFTDLTNELNRNSVYSSLGYGLTINELNRLQFLKDCVRNNMFGTTISENNVNRVAEDIKKQTYRYVSNQISNGNILFT